MEPLRFNEDYVNRLKTQDPEAENQFVAYFSNLLAIKLGRTIRSPQLISDVRQETLLRVLKTVRSNGLENPERLGAFVCAVCNNVLLEHLRAEGRFQPAPETLEPVDDRISPDRELINAERKRQVEETLAELAPKDRDLLRMVFLEEADRDEVSRRLRVTPEYLRVVLHRAKNRFREKYLAANGGSGETGTAATSL